MQITQAGKYIKLSSFSSELTDNLEDYTKLVVTGNINCCESNCIGQNATSETTLGSTSWVIDLNEATELNNKIFKLTVRDILGFNTANVITSPIDLSYVETTCIVDTCTLEDFSGHFAPLFKTAIDTWFGTVGITSHVVVTFDGNKVIINTLPSGFTLFDASYGVIEGATVSEPFGYNDIDAKFFIGSDGSVYILPTFFDENATLFTDGIYKFIAKYVKEDNASYYQEENCAFIDITIKCKVAGTLASLIAQTKDTDTEPEGVLVQTLHYALVNGSNCTCNCTELCAIYKSLIDMLQTIEPQNENCGC